MAGALRPDIAVLDIGLPGMNGYELAQAIRRQPWGREITLIAVTGWGQLNDRRRSGEAGFNHHLVKPVEPTALLQLIADPTAPASSVTAPPQAARPIGRETTRARDGSPPDRTASPRGRADTVPARHAPRPSPGPETPPARGRRRSTAPVRLGPDPASARIRSRNANNSAGTPAPGFALSELVAIIGATPSWCVNQLYHVKPEKVVGSRGIEVLEKDCRPRSLSFLSAGQTLGSLLGKLIGSATTPPVFRGMTKIHSSRCVRKADPQLTAIWGCFGERAAPLVGFSG